jgi:hypothetical protein
LKINANQGTDILVWSFHININGIIDYLTKEYQLQKLFEIEQDEMEIMNGEPQRMLRLEVFMTMNI